jgi:O-antigen/teichoic acid export membrane protein
MLRNTIWMLLGLGPKFVLQLIAFVLLARALGVQAFGAFSGALALATLLSPLVEMGGYSLIVRDIAAKIPVSRALGNTLLLGILTLPLSLGLLLAIKPFALPDVTWQVVLCVALAELLGARLLALVTAVHVAQGVLWRNAILEVTAGVVRLGLVGVLILSEGRIELWSWLYLAQTLMVGMGAIAWVWHSWGRPTARWIEMRSRVRPGLHFAVGLAAQSAYTDLDKAMLPRLAGLADSGIYASAFRFLTVAFLPLNAFLGAVYPRFFETGQHGYDHARRLAWRTLRVTAGYGLAALLVLWVLAPLLPFLLGSEFADSVNALRLLAVVLFIQSLYYPFADALTGSGRQEVRSRGQVAALLLNAALNIMLIPLYGWAGAAYATIVSQVLLLLLFTSVKSREDA